MNFYGLQKLSLVDYPGKMACTVFTGGCNFRCPFCHNAGLVIDIDEINVLSEDDVLAFLKKRAGMLDAVCISGGEPLLNPGIGDFIKKAKDMGYSVKLDTNGSFPARLREIIRAGLPDYVAMDIKNSPEKYAETVGVCNFDISSVRESVDILMEEKVPYEFRTTLVHPFHELSDMKKIGAWIQGARAYYLQQFKDSGHLIGDRMQGFSVAEMQEFLDVSRQFVSSAQLRGVE